MKQLKMIIWIAALALAGLACSLVERVAESTPPPTVEVQAAPPQALPTETQPPAPTAVPAPPLQVAYIKEKNVWLWRETGGSQALTRAGGVNSVNLSPDGSIVAFIRQVGELDSELWAVNTDGSNERKLVSVDEFRALVGAGLDPNASGVAAMQFDWQPGTQRLYFNTRPVFMGPGYLGHDDLYVVDAGSLEKTPLLPAGQGGLFHFSPDASRMALVTPGSIGVANPDGSGYRLLLEYPHVTTYSEYLYYAKPVWAPDGASLWVAIPPAEALGEGPQITAIWNLPLDGPARKVIDLEAAPFFGSEAVISPDLAWVAYVRQEGTLEENRSSLHLLHIGGEGAPQVDIPVLEATSIQVLEWSGDSQKYLFTASVGDQHQLYQGLSDGSYRLAGGSPAYGQVRWLDATRYFVTRPLGEAWELRLEALDGSGVVIDNVPTDPPGFDF